MDPNEALTELREWYNAWQDSNLDEHDLARFMSLFDDLDNWLMNGGFLPRAWRR